MEHNDIIIAVDSNVPIIFGECHKCKSGDRSLILVDYVPNKKNSIESTVYIKCMCCRTLYQSKVKNVAR